MFGVNKNINSHRTRYNIFVIQTWNLVPHVSRTMVEGVSTQVIEEDIWTYYGRSKRRLEKTA